MASVTSWAFAQWENGTLTSDFSSGWRTSSLAKIQAGYTGNNEVIGFRFQLDTNASQFNLKLCNHASSVNSGSASARKLRYKVLASDASAYHNTTADTAYDGTITTAQYTYTAVTTTIVAADCGISYFRANTYYYIFIFAWDYSSGSNYQNLRAYSVTSTYGTGIPASSIVEYVGGDGGVSISNGASFDSYQIYISDGTEFHQYKPYISNGSEWVEYGT